MWGCDGSGDVSENGRFKSNLGWILLGSFLTLALYLPVWLVVGTLAYSGTHPDYWDFNTPVHIFPIAGALAALSVLFIRRITRNQ
jgi:hypothetical protein